MKLKISLAACLFFFIASQSFIAYKTVEKQDVTELFKKLSEYNLYEGDYARLIPQKEFVAYRLSTPLFSDYAEKERLVKIPAGLAMTATGDGLPQFPDGTILAKTFFYWNDKRDSAKGRRIIETRILVKSNGGWQAGTYIWNAGQTDAVLTNGGEKIRIKPVDAAGDEMNINYQVPTISQCGNCHNANKTLLPIGFKIRNLNITVPVNGTPINQLQYFSSLRILNPVRASSFATLPAWNDTAYSIEQRARAYLEVNCAHCHHQNGFCAKSDFRPAYENTFDMTHISEKKEQIIKFLKAGRMPLIGTTVIHKEGIALIENYLKNLQQP